MLLLAKFVLIAMIIVKAFNLAGFTQNPLEFCHAGDNMFKCYGWPQHRYIGHKVYHLLVEYMSNIVGIYEDSLAVYV